jgi:hypothetical protein
VSTCVELRAEIVWHSAYALIIGLGSVVHVLYLLGWRSPGPS